MSRQISERAANKFKNNLKFKLSNTEVKVVDGQPEMYLFGNKIAWKANGITHWTLAGYPSSTTKERLNALLNGKIFQYRGNQYYSNWNVPTVRIQDNKVYTEDGLCRGL